MKKILSVSVILALLLALAVSTSACASKTTTDAKSPSGTPGLSGTVSSPDAPGTPENPTQGDVSVPPVTDGTEDPTQQGSPSGVITFNGANVDTGSTGAGYKDGVLTISKAGSYELSGKSDNCAIVVNVDKSEQVELILAGLELTNPAGPAIYCDSADKLFITAKEGTSNHLKDGTGYPASAETDGPNATIYSDDDLTIRGTGSLKVTALYNNAISSKNDIKIKEVTLTVDAYNTGIRGKESVTVSSGKLTIKASNDAIKATEDVEEGKGFVTIEGGELILTAGDDALQAATVLTVSGGKISASAGGKLTNAPTENVTSGIING